MAQLERRQQRSQNVSKALHLQLASSLCAAPLTGLVLSDEDGMTLAEAGDTNACREVAARLPLLGTTLSTFDGIVMSPECGYPVEVERVASDNSLLYLCAIGGKSSTRGKLLAKSKTGIRRILSRTE